MDAQLVEILGRNLRDFRTVEAEGTEEFARKLGIDRELLEGIEMGTADPDLKTLESLAARIGMEPLLLLEQTRRREDAGGEKK